MKDDLRAYILAKIRECAALDTPRVVRKWFGSEYQEHSATSRRLEAAADYAAHPSAANERRWLAANQTRREVDALCASISAGRKGNLR